MKRRSHWTEDKIQRFIKEGRGSGEGQNYKPWLTIQDVPSEGVTERKWGWKTKRIHHFLSQLECQVFYAFEWSDCVIDIKEQYPLNRNSTVEIAEKLNIKHPKYPNSDVTTVLTTDFVIKVADKQGYKTYARTVKMSKDLEKRRTIEKLEIERVYWENRGIDWGIITENEINKYFAKNMEYIHSSYFLPDDLQEKALCYQQDLILLINNTEGTYLELLKHFSSLMGISIEESIAIFKHLVARKKITINMFEDFSLYLPNKTIG
jgi:hypothetical protein